jgi:hypothetical protein
MTKQLMTTFDLINHPVDFHINSAAGNTSMGKHFAEGQLILFDVDVSPLKSVYCRLYIVLQEEHNDGPSILTLNYTFAAYPQGSAGACD